MRFSNVCTGCLLAGAAIALAACGGGSNRSHQSPRTARSEVVDIYSSMPMRGSAAAEAIALANGIKLALRQDGHKAGRWKVTYVPLDDSGSGGEWSAAQTAANARRAAADPNAVYYIGEFYSSGSEISIPLLNQADVPQVSPTNTYVGLTRSLPGKQAHGGPSFYPTGTRTFLRLMPTDTVQAGALLLAMKQAGCTKVAVANDGEPYGTGLAALLETEKTDYGVQIVSSTSVSADPSGLRRYAQTIRLLAADCFLYAGTDSRAAVQLTLDVNGTLPVTKIFGSDRICSGSWTNPALGGVPGRIDPLIECSMPTLTLSEYPGGKAFLGAYQAAYGTSDPNVYAIYGYEAMKLGLDTITRLGVKGDIKSAVRTALFATHDRHSVIGTYGFDQGGDTTLRAYGLYRVGTGGNPMFVRTLSPPKTM